MLPGKNLGGTTELFMFMLRPKALRGIFYFMEVTMDDKILKLKQDLENDLEKI